MSLPPPHTPGPAESLAAAASAGDPDAVDAWYRAEWPRVYRLTLGLLADAAEAEDVAQDAMLHLLDHLDDWDPGRPWQAWRDAVVVRRCRDRRRRQRARAHHEDVARERPRGAAPDPSDAAQAEDVRRLLEACLVELPEREREAFVLRDLEGRATSEVAAAMEIGASSVRSLLTLARRRLRARLGPLLAGACPEEEAR